MPADHRAGREVAFVQRQRSARRAHGRIDERRAVAARVDRRGGAAFAGERFVIDGSPGLGNHDGVA